MNLKHVLLAACLFSAIPLALAQNAGSAAAEPSITGKVVETMSTAGYTYVLVDTGTKKVWAAGLQFAVKVGDPVTFAAGNIMQNFHSQSLNRDFDQVYFTGSITVNNAGSDATTAVPTLPPGHPSLSETPAPVLPPGHPSLEGQSASPAPDLTLTGIKPAADGQTIQQIFASAAKLAGKPVSVRGKVVKYNAMILGKNWLHIQDGSGSAGKKDNDLTVTTQTTAQPGDIVLVTGVLSTGKDFGANYKYDVMLDDATVTVEGAK